MAVKFYGNIKDDPTIKNLLHSMPDTVRDSFTEEQLSYLKNAVGSRKWGHHSIDIRGTVKGVRHRYYYVFLVGKNKRTVTRLEQRVSRFLLASIVTLFMFVCLMLGLLALYVAKSALGINLFDDFSLGLWTWLNH